MKIYLCSKVKYILGEISDDLSNIQNKKAIVLPWSFPNELGSEDLEEKWIIPGMSKYYEKLTNLDLRLLLRIVSKRRKKKLKKILKKVDF